MFGRSCHGATDLSPVCMAAALHFDLSVHNFGIQEYMRHTAETDKVFPHAYYFENGLMHPGDRPGLGVDLNEVLAANYPIQTRVPTDQSQARWHHAQLVAEEETVKECCSSTAGPPLKDRRT